MIKRYVYSGYIEVDYNLLISLLKELLIASKVRDRYASDIEKEINYNDENVDIYIHEDGHRGFIFDCELKGTFEEANKFIDTLTKRFKVENLKHQFEWNEIDKEDNQIGEEYEIVFPER
ncbi:hypothetical protein [Tenacibaculum singaporense]|uniref:Uncharacterized protein n=1 Tax=Tenacibaculum singaporense TaxID=2358479 RepID=A0A3S8R476_9FLAO|nr:hypothetical protein [Tenacibaculum singaporense]AZJ34557.1 hypothetical protein D6T69_03025 [Tenacibaculum singaporense]